MKENRYKIGYNRLLTKMKEVAREYNVSHYRLMFDAAKCFIRYGVTPNEYIAWEFYKLSAIERKTFFTARDAYKWYKRFNPPQLAHLFDNKQETNKLFKDYIKRDWLFTDNASIDDIDLFIKSHDRIIIKPTNQAQGKGVHIYGDDDSPEKLKKSHVLLEEYICQHHAIAQLNESSVNTIRIYTLSIGPGKKNNLKRNYCSKAQVVEGGDSYIIS